MTSLLWGQHTCLPSSPDADVNVLTRYQRGGGAFVSVNAGYTPRSFRDTMALLAHYRAAVEAHPDLDLATSTDVAAITQAGHIAVTFDLEDSPPLDDELDNLATLASLGVRTLLPTYNHANRAGSGCLDAVDGGLTGWGRAWSPNESARDGSRRHALSAPGPASTCARSRPGPVVYSRSRHALGLGAPA